MSGELSVLFFFFYHQAFELDRHSRQRHFRFRSDCYFGWRRTWSLGRLELKRLWYSWLLRTQILLKACRSLYQDRNFLLEYLLICADTLVVYLQYLSTHPMVKVPVYIRKCFPNGHLQGIVTGCDATFSGVGPIPVFSIFYVLSNFYLCNNLFLVCFGVVACSSKFSQIKSQTWRFSP